MQTTNDMRHSRSIFNANAAIVLAIALLAAVAPRQAAAQAEPTARGPGSYTQIGVTGSLYETDYGKHLLGGVSGFVDANLYRRTGVEAEARLSRFNQSEGTHNSTYLVGPRVTLLRENLRPYAKLLVGRGVFYFPFGYAKGTYFVVAPGFGVDWRVARGKLTIRLIDVEFQRWPGFTFGEIKPYGISSGIALRVF
jgi:hypothetical protein